MESISHNLLSLMSMVYNGYKITFDSDLANVCEVVDKKTGNKIPEHFIENMEFAVNGEVIAQANLGTGVSKNPLIGVGIPNAKPGDTVTVSWVDNKGESDSAEKAVK